MASAQLDYMAYVPEWGTITIDSIEDIEEAEAFGLKEIKETFPEYSDIEITSVRMID